MASETRNPVQHLTDLYLRDMEVMRQLVDDVLDVQRRARLRGDRETADELVAVVCEATQHLRGGSA